MMVEGVKKEQKSTKEKCHDTESTLNAEALYLNDVNDQKWQKGERHSDHVEEGKANKCTSRCQHVRIIRHHVGGECDY